MPALKIGFEEITILNHNFINITALFKSGMHNPFFRKLIPNLQFKPGRIKLD